MYHISRGAIYSCSHVTLFVFAPHNNNGSFIALIELHAQVRTHQLSPWLCNKWDAAASGIPSSHRTSVRPELAAGPLMVLTPSFIQPQAAELRGLRISSPGNTNNLTREICLSLVHHQPNRQAGWRARTLQSCRREGGVGWWGEWGSLSKHFD